MVFPAVNLKDIDEVPEDVRKQLEMIPVDTMDDVFAVALHRVIVPQKIGGNFVIEVEDDEDDESEESPSAQAPRLMRGFGSDEG